MFTKDPYNLNLLKMNKALCLFFFTLFLSLLSSGCSNDLENEDKSNKDCFNDTATFRRTVIVYMAAENSLGGYTSNTSCSMADSAEIVNSAVYMNKYDNVLMYIDDANESRIYRVCKPTSGQSIRLVKKYNYNQCSSDPQVLQEVLTWSKQNYPSASYGLVMWSHGDSWLPSPNTKYPTRSFGIDNNGNGYFNTTKDGEIGLEMNINDMARVITASKINLDFIFFDACMMQSIEVSYELRNATRYIIGAPCVTPGIGAYYTSLIKNGFFAYPASDQNISEIAKNYYHAATTMPEYTSYGIVLSVVKTSELETLATATKKIIEEAISKKASHDMTTIQPYSFYHFKLFYRPELFDAASAMKTLLSEASYTEWRKAMDRAVIYKQATPHFYVFNLSLSWPSQSILSQCPNYSFCEQINSKNEYYIKPDQDTYCGVSMFVPNQIYTAYADRCLYGNLNHAFKTTAWYKAAGWEKTGW